MLLYTVHGKGNGTERSSVADRSGLSSYLGYRPMFCTLVNERSLADTWFRIYSASPSYVEAIDVLEVDAGDATPMDVVDWCNLCIRSDYPSDDGPFKLMMNTNHPESVDYLLSPEARLRRTWRFDALDLLNCQVGDLPGGEEQKKALLLSLRRLRDMPSQMSGLFESTSGRDALSGPLTMETWYRLMTLSGMVPFVWATVTGTDVSPRLIDFDPVGLSKTRGVQRAQELLARWDNTLGEDEEFPHSDFQAMRSAFIEGCDQLAHSISEGVATQLGLGRNDECFCGSGRKYKKCCARKGLDELALT